jgi:hypothetical protein
MQSTSGARRVGSQTSENIDFMTGAFISRCLRDPFSRRWMLSGPSVAIVGSAASCMLVFRPQRAARSLSSGGTRAPEAARQMGADYIIGVKIDDPISAVKDLTGGRGQTT